MADLIFRLAAIAALEEPRKVSDTWTDEYAVGERMQWEKDVKALNSLPSAERLGLWEDVEHAPNGLLYVTCSVCGKRQTVEFTSYCGNCGAKMYDEQADYGGRGRPFDHTGGNGIPTVYYDGRPPKAGEGCMVVNGVGYFHAEDEVEE